MLRTTGDNYDSPLKPFWKGLSAFVMFEGELSGWCVYVTLEEAVDQSLIPESSAPNLCVEREPDDGNFRYF